MARLSRALALALPLLAAPFIAWPAWADVVALAVAVEGTTEPAIEPFSEIEAGTSITLGEGGRIEFMHYGTCESVVVVGGRLVFTERQYLVQKGKIAEVRRAKCPEVATAKGGNLGGVLLRSAGGELKLLPSPRFAVAGQSRAAYNRLRVVKGSSVVLEAPLTGSRFDWPQGAAPLAPADDYAVLLLRRDGGQPVRFDFQVAAKRGTAPLTVLRLD